MLLLVRAEDREPPDPRLVVSSKQGRRRSLEGPPKCSSTGSPNKLCQPSSESCPTSPGLLPFLPFTWHLTVGAVSASGKLFIGQRNLPANDSRRIRCPPPSLSNRRSLRLAFLGSTASLFHPRFFSRHPSHTHHGGYHLSQRAGCIRYVNVHCHLVRAFDFSRPFSHQPTPSQYGIQCQPHVGLRQCLDYIEPRSLPCWIVPPSTTPRLTKTLVDKADYLRSHIARALQHLISTTQQTINMYATSFVGLGLAALAAAAPQGGFGGHGGGQGGGRWGDWSQGGQGGPPQGGSQGPPGGSGGWEAWSQASSVPIISSTTYIQPSTTSSIPVVISSTTTPVVESSKWVEWTTPVQSTTPSVPVVISSTTPVVVSSSKWEDWSSVVVTTPSTTPAVATSQWQDWSSSSSKPKPTTSSTTPVVVSSTQHWQDWSSQATPTTTSSTTPVAISSAVWQDWSSVYVPSTTPIVPVPASSSHGWGDWSSAKQSTVVPVPTTPAPITTQVKPSTWATSYTPAPSTTAPIVPIVSFTGAAAKPTLDAQKFVGAGLAIAVAAML